MRPSSKRTTPPSIGGPSTGRTQSADTAELTCRSGYVARAFGAALEQHRRPDRRLVEHEQRDRLHDRRHRVDARQQDADAADDEVADAARAAQRARLDDPDPRQPDHEERQLEDDRHRDEHLRREADVVACADEVLVLRPCRSSRGSARPSAARSSSRTRRRPRACSVAMKTKTRSIRACDGVEGGQEERPRLPDDDRQREQEPGVDREPQRRHERLADRQRRQLAVALRQLELEPVDRGGGGRRTRR